MTLASLISGICWTLVYICTVRGVQKTEAQRYSQYNGYSNQRSNKRPPFRTPAVFYSYFISNRLVALNLIMFYLPYLSYMLNYLMLYYFLIYVPSLISCLNFILPACW